MDLPIPKTELNCTQCGGELHPDEGQIFLNCTYCGSAVYLDKSRVVFHWYLAPTIDEAQGRASLARWMAGNETVKDLDKKSSVTSVNFEYFPVWFFKRRAKGGQEQIRLELAAASSVSELRNIELLAGDLRKYSSDLDAQARPPTVPLPTALGWLAESRVPQNEIIEQALVHLPLYIFKYTYRNQTYIAIVEAGTGKVFANLFPAKAEAPYQLVGSLTAIIYLGLALIPVVMGVAADTGGAAIGFGICLGAGVLFAPLLLAAAAYVAAKI